jgi:carbon starvation protein
MSSPFWFVLLALIVYFIAYRVYGKWYDRTVWKPDRNRTTPAHMYTDGVEYFPVSKYVLWGYQFKSVAALGPVLGPFIAIQFGWVPALIWIVAGNFFIGWLQDYGDYGLRP